MQCDYCGKPVSGIEEYPNVYGFRFCSPLEVPIEQECCEDIFERKLWEAAQARKEAGRKTEAPAAEVRTSTQGLVEGIRIER